MTPRSGEVQVKARVLVEPKLDLVMFVGGVVVEDQVEIEGFGRLLIDGAQEAQKLLMAVTPHALSDDRTGGDIKGGEQRSCSMPLVIMGHRAGPPLLDRQPGWVRSSAWTWLFSSTLSTMALSGGLR